MLETLKPMVLAAAVALAGSAWANDAGSEARFRDLDRNGDGFVSRDEGKDAEELNTRFTELDVNNDNKLSRDEYAVLEREAREAAAKAAKDQRRTSATGGSK